MKKLIIPVVFLMLILAGCGSSKSQKDIAKQLEDGIEEGLKDASREISLVPDDEDFGAMIDDFADEVNSAINDFSDNIGIDDHSLSTGQKNALQTAKSYLKTMAFSYKGLIDQLEFEGYSSEEAAYAVDNCGADWNEQAVQSAKNYLKSMAYSEKGLIEQLEFEGFTSEEAEYGAKCALASNNEKSEANGMTVGQENALKAAKGYLKYMAYSYKGLFEQLQFEGYSDEDAKYGVDNCGADWNEQAAECAKNYLKYMSYSRQGLLEQLEFEGFTAEQAEYGVSAVGY